MSWNPFSDAPSSFIDLLHEENDELSEDDNEDFWEALNDDEEAVDENVVEEAVADEVNIPVHLSGIYTDSGEALFEVDQTTIASPSPPRRDASPIPSTSRGTVASPTSELPVVIIGQRRGRGGRRRGSGRGSRGGGRVGGYGRMADDAVPSWRPGDPIREIYITDADVPEELRLQVQAVIEKRDIRQRKDSESKNKIRIGKQIKEQERFF
ncbi:uncharacterized protein LOC123663563 [Melitaea cinxia]|uniref:uncharacterized protein LOC123660079 n=1 Tax=Melitaea cinxia TaxID=113334 RepID=UPI001E2722EC|nr:uncharacterized protein LOC123660079 [Melitaea cinxia]XP_045452632.1 uncharacterized protein LOC123661731 [Melitaea cinxia]XP_045454192.1 uncharacterized protein LOC123663563 [Melitaea cinxia]